MIGERLNNRYEILEEIGRGGMGTVYLAKDEVRDETLALKLLHAGQGMSEQKIAYFKREFEALTKLSHPNLAQVFDFGAISGSAENGDEEAIQYFFTSEYVEGEDLIEAGESLDEDALYEVVVQVLRALEYIHSRGLIHHDIKPQNILVQNEDGAPTAKLLDFGLAGEARQARKIKGTIHFLPPEVAKGDRVDKRADLYSLGITLYRVTTGKLPFEGRTLTEVIRQHIDAIPPAPSELEDGVPEILSDVTMKLMAKEPSDRYPSANAVIRDLAERTGRDFEPETKKTIESYVLSGRFVGRDPELSFLKEWYEKVHVDETLEGRLSLPRIGDEVSTPILLLVSGEAGIGKSRLMREHRYQVQLRGGEFFVGLCHEGGDAAYAPFPELLGRVVRLEEGEEETSDRVHRDAAELAKILPELADRYDVDPSTPLEPDEERIRLMETVAGFFIDVARKQPFVLLLEDLHWASRTSLDLLRILLRRLQGAWNDEDEVPHLTVCATYRTDELTGSNFERALRDLRSEPTVAEVPLQSLTSEEVGRLIGSMVGTPIPFEKVEARIARETGGNPFFVEELLKSFAEEGVFRFADGSWRLDEKATETLPLPHSIGEVLNRRLERLDSAALRLLDVLAAVGRPANLRLICQVMEKAADDLYPDLDDLHRRQILNREASEDDYRFGFNNDRMRDLVYDRIPADRKKRLHRAVGKAIESLQKPHEEHEDELAYHFLRGGSRKKAITYSLQAGDKSRLLYANDKAIEFYSAALGLLEDEDLSEKEVSQKRRALGWRGEISIHIGNYAQAREDFEEDLRLIREYELEEGEVEGLIRLGKSKSLLGEKDDALEDLREALSLAEENDDGYGQGEALNEIANVLFDQGHYEEAIEQYENALDKKKKAGKQEEIAKGYREMATCLFEKGDYHRSLEYCREALRIDREIGNRAGAAHDMMDLAQVLYYLGKYDRSLESAQEALEENRVIGSRHGVASALNVRGHVLHGRGRLDEAAASYREALEIWDRIGDKPGVAAILNNLGIICDSQGNFEKAIQHYSDSTQLFQQAGYKGSVALGLGNLAVSHLCLGELETALDYSQRAYERAREVGNRRVEIEAQRSRGELLAAQGNLHTGLEHCEKALAASREIHNRLLECLTLVTMGPVLSRLGQMQEARECLEKAREIAADLGERALEASACFRLADVHLLTGALWTAFECYEAGSEAAQNLLDQKIIVERSLTEGRIFSLTGHLKKARQAFERARELIEETRYGYREPETACALARLELLGAKGADEPDLEPARTAIEEAIEAARRVGETPWEHEARLLAAEADLDETERLEDTGRLDDIIEEAKDSGDRRLLLEASLLYARADLASGNLSEAQSHVDEALRLSEEMGGALNRMLAQRWAGRIQEKAGRFKEAARCMREALLGVNTIWSDLEGDAKESFLASPLVESLKADCNRILEIADTEAELKSAGPEEPETERAPITDSHLDRLTKLYNHNYFVQRLDEEISRSRRHGRQLSLLKTNIDGFKLINELHGPKAGRAVIRDVGDLLDHSIRDIDILARYFGDEFEVLLPDTETEGALRIATRLKDEIAESEFAVDGKDLDLTVSFGIASFPYDAEDRETLFCKADEALYNAKAQGDDQIFCFRREAESQSRTRPFASSEFDNLLLSREGRAILGMVNRIVNQELKLDALVDLVIGMIVEATQAERGFLMLVEDDQLVFKAGRNFEDKDLDSEEPNISTGVVQLVMREGEPILIEEAMEDERLKDFQSVMDLQLRSILCAPIKVEDEVIGLAYVDHNSISRKFMKEDLNFLEAISEKIAVPLKNSRTLAETERELDKVRAQLDKASESLQTKYSYDKIIGNSPAMQDVFKYLDRIIDTQHSVVIHGESGTGKELIARAIHFNGPRKDKPFIAENCAALPDTLLEAELFGHVKGSFTGADRDKQGLFELADGGTLFLDEIGDMTMEMQKKLLRVLQEGEVRPVGGKKVIKVNVRIISASNKDLLQLVKNGEFREDLYYRLNVITLRLPPLRKRKEDIPALVDHFLNKIVEEDEEPKSITKEALRHLMDYDWPGNVRELENEVNRMSMMADSDVIDVDDLDSRIEEAKSTTTGGQEISFLEKYRGKSLKEIQHELAREIITQTLEETNWHRTRTAEILGLPTSTLYNKMKKLDIG